MPPTHKLNLQKPVPIKEKTICFCAIFRNESKNVRRCLNATKGVIDYLSIVDTGSTDNTVEEIENWCKENNINYKVHFEPFRDFGYNRTHSYEMAKKSFPEADYFLLLDADMVLEVNPGFDKRDLRHGSYQLIQHNRLIRYANLRLISNKHQWECIGVTHEYWGSKDNASAELLHTLSIDDRDDGGCKSDKLERDKRLLTEGLDDPKTTEGLRGRYYFYLAQTYRDLGKAAYKPGENGKNLMEEERTTYFLESIKYYKLRIDYKPGAWDEELFYSQFQIATCYEHLGRTEMAAGSYLEAWNRRMTRAEPLYELARMYRHQAKYHLSFMMAKQAKDIPLPIDDKLFVSHITYNYCIDEELSMTGFYVDSGFEEGKMAIKRILENKEAPEDLKKRVEGYRTLYTQKEKQIKHGTGPTSGRQ